MSGPVGVLRGIAVQEEAQFKGLKNLGRPAAPSSCETGALRASRRYCTQRLFS